MIRNFPHPLMSFQDLNTSSENSRLILRSLRTSLQLVEVSQRSGA